MTASAPPVSTRVPDVRLTTGRLYESLREGRFVLITPRTALPAWGIDSPSRKGRLAVETWASDRRTTVLVRPDGYAAWAADSTEGADAATVEAALTAWLGADAAS
ncbi:aromatic-ring hydroxylase C-terminal domain-containing protein [Streptomyces europaeiscabiei]|uniref:aromatic-ring hydroxylase C-terminal domain-containing protein n=1 Tax=Streptomyces europaeiscabiei TaxID=146819 RepID=UPI0038D480A5